MCTLTVISTYRSQHRKQEKDHRTHVSEKSRPVKVFNERETAEILKLAAENSHAQLQSDGLGLTINELEEIAKDSGIDPSEIHKAVEAIHAKRQPDEKTFWGGPFSFSEQIQIDHEITAAEWEKMLVPIRAFFQSKGEVNERESVHEWTSPRGTSNSAHITALKDNGKTNISVGWTGPLTALPFYLPIPLVAIASLPFASEFLGLGPVAGFSFIALSISATFLTGRWALRRHLGKGSHRMRELVATLQGWSHNENEQSDAGQAEQHRPSLASPDKEPLIKLDLDVLASEGNEAKVPGRTKE